MAEADGREDGEDCLRGLLRGRCRSYRSGGQILG
jgi:hypothetical protein